MNPWTGIVAVLVALGALMLGVSRLQSEGRIGGETARKLVHMGMGSVCLGFPWLFAEAWPVWVLTGLAIVALVALRFLPTLRRALGGVLHDVNRTSLGELYFPVGVATVFTMAQGRVIPFVVPVAMLTFADAMGALIGQRWGRRRFQTLEGMKSVEGSLAVGITGFLCSAGPMFIAGYDAPTSLVIGAVMGLFALLLEAIAWRGLDNVFLPLAAFAQISVYLHASIGALLTRLAVLIVLTVLAIIWRRGNVMDHSARLGAALAFYFFWAIGGWTWLIAPLVLIVAYVRLMPAIPGGVPRHNLLAVICVSSAGLLWCVAHAFSADQRWWGLFTLGIATHQAVIALVRNSQAHPQWPRTVWWAVGFVQTLITQGIAFWLVDRERTISKGSLLLGAVCLALALAAFLVSEKNLQMPDNLNARWWKQAAAAVIASLAGFVLLTT
jgi:phytol kinase